MEKTPINPKDVAEPVRNSYSHAIKSGNLLFISGQIPMDAQGRIVGVRDIRAQTRQVFENLGAVLKEAGATFDNIVKWNGYLVNMDENLVPHAEVRAEFFSKQPLPAATLVEVKSLAMRDFLLEVEAIAVLDA